MEAKLSTVLAKLLNSDSDQLFKRMYSKASELMRSIARTNPSMSSPVEVSIILACIVLKQRADYELLAQLSNINSENIRKQVTATAKTLGISVIVHMRDLQVVFDTPSHFSQFSQQVERLVSQKNGGAVDQSLITLCSFYLTCKALKLKRCTRDKIISQSLVNSTLFDSMVKRLESDKDIKSLLDTIGESSRALSSTASVKRSHSNDEGDAMPSSKRQKKSIAVVDGINSMLARIPWNQSEKYKSYIKWRAETLRELNAL